MANSKRKDILTYLRDTVLPGITTGSGFNTTVAFIERGARNLQTLSDDKFPALFLASADEARKNETHVHFKSILSVFVMGWVKDTADPGKVQDLLDDLIEDVTKKVYEDPNLGGRSLWLEVVNVATDVGDLESHAGFVMQIDIEYSATRSQP